MDDSRFTFSESLRKQPFIYLLWLSAIALSSIIYWNVVSYRNKFTVILFIVMISLMVMNMIFSSADPIGPYAEEVAAYKFVEDSARSFLPFGIAIAALFIASASTGVNISIDKKILYPLLAATICFIFVLMPIWMPKKTGAPIRYLRDVKSSLLILGGTMVIVLVGQYITAYVSR